LPTIASFEDFHDGGQAGVHLVTAFQLGHDGRQRDRRYRHGGQERLEQQERNYVQARNRGCRSIPLGITSQQTTDARAPIFNSND
jgi:hypothetical protein